MTRRRERERISLAELRRRAEGLHGERSLRGLAAALRRDPRAGARALAERCERRRERLAGERLRLARLFALRRRLVRAGFRRVAGVDEVGMGPLAGPVVAAAVVLPERPDLPGLDDSKRLLAAERERLFREIERQSLAVGIAELWPEDIDRLNIYRAGLEAMSRAVRALSPAPEHVLVDARALPDLELPQTAIVRGDALDGSIAAASILAKVHRDAIMARLDAEFPGYGFARHKGYATRQHLERLRRLGPSPVHRRSFAPVSQLRLF